MENAIEGSATMFAGPFFWVRFFPPGIPVGPGCHNYLTLSVKNRYTCNQLQNNNILNRAIISVKITRHFWLAHRDILGHNKEYEGHNRNSDKGLATFGSHEDTWYSACHYWYV